MDQSLLPLQTELPQKTPSEHYLDDGLLYDIDTKLVAVHPKAFME